MRRLALAAALALIALAPAAPTATAADAPAKDLPKPPTTPLPKFENPLFDAEVGETCLYLVHEPGVEKKDAGWTLYFEERVLAKTEKRILVQTIKTDETGAKNWGDDNPSTGWRDRTETLVSPATPLPEGWKFLNDKDREEVVYLGKPGEKPTKAVRTVHKQLEFPEFQQRADGPKKIRHVWYSHDVPVLGRAKQFPAQNQGERIAISWEKKLSADECATLAAKYPDEALNAPKKPPQDAGMDSGMDGGMDNEPGMGDAGMDDSGMGESGMGAEPGMSEPSMG